MMQQVNVMLHTFLLFIRLLSFWIPHWNWVKFITITIYKLLTIEAINWFDIERVNDEGHYLNNGNNSRIIFNYKWFVIPAKIKIWSLNTQYWIFNFIISRYFNKPLKKIQLNYVPSYIM